MLIANGSVTRNIKADKLPEYVAKGYAEVKQPSEKPKAAKTGKK